MSVLVEQHYRTYNVIAGKQELIHLKKEGIQNGSHNNDKRKKKCKKV